MMMGDPFFLAASRAALTVLVEVQLMAGIANLCSRANARISLWPYTFDKATYHN